MKFLITWFALGAAAFAFAGPAPQSSAQNSSEAAPQSQAAEAQILHRLETMQRTLEAQQQQIKQLNDQVQSQNALIERLQQRQKDNAATAPGQTASDTLSSTAAKPAAAEETSASLVETKRDRLSDLAHGKIKIGATFFGDWTDYTSTGFGPQWYDTVNQPGPGNNGANAFDVTRAYLNFYYTPNEYITLRITPDIYRQVDGTSGPIPYGNGAQVTGSTNGSLAFRLKYAYVDFNQLFSGSETFGKDKLTFGQTTVPFVGWEEELTGYRYTYLTPWNYVGLSSTYTGVKLHGPIVLHGKEYLNYGIGVFSTTNYHAIDTSDKKQIIGALTWYPMGTSKDQTGLGLTAFEDYGYNTRFPSQVSTPLNRLALLGSYQTTDRRYQIAAEYDLGRNAFGVSNMFSGVGPVAGGTYDAFNTLAANILGGTSTRQQGFASFGHARLGHSPFGLWGIYQYFQPNTHYANNPLDFARTVGGVSYTVNEHFDFAVGNENLHYAHPQGLVPGGDTNAVAVFTQFNY